VPLYESNTLFPVILLVFIKHRLSYSLTLHVDWLAIALTDSVRQQCTNIMLESGGFKLYMGLQRVSFQFESKSWAVVFLIRILWSYCARMRLSASLKSWKILLPYTKHAHIRMWRRHQTKAKISKKYLRISNQH